MQTALDSLQIIGVMTSDSRSRGFDEETIWTSEYDLAFYDAKSSGVDWLDCGGWFPPKNKVSVACVLVSSNFIFRPIS
jgi:hypothetical protein